jgi:hypothetical protein
MASYKMTANCHNCLKISSVNNTTNIDIEIQSSSIVITLTFLLDRFVSQLSLLFIIFGLIGLNGNIFTFLQRELRSNTFCIYSLCSSLVDASNILFNHIPNYLYQENKYTFAWDTNSSLCKFESFTLIFLPQLAINFLVLSLIDLYACTCSLTSSMRRLNQLRLAPWFISITIIYSCLAVFHGPIFNEIGPNVGCIAISPVTNSILYIVFCGLMQPVTTLIFVFLTYRNICNSRRRVVKFDSSSLYCFYR